MDFAPCAAAFDIQPGFTGDYRAVVPRVSVPTLVLQSRDDPAVPMQVARWLADNGGDETKHIVVLQGNIVVRYWAR